MNIGGGEAADQMVRMLLSGTAERIAPEDLKTLVQLLADKDHPSQGPSLGGLSM